MDEGNHYTTGVYMLYMTRTDTKKKGREEDRLTFQLLFGQLVISHFRGEKLVAQYAASDMDVNAIKTLCEQHIACCTHAR